MLTIYDVATYEDRGASNVRPQKDSSSFSRTSIYNKDLVGCGTKTHWIFQSTAQFNSLDDCKITNEGFVSISGGLKRTNPSFPTGVQSMVNFLVDRIMASSGQANLNN